MRGTEQGKIITDDTRIRRSMPTIEYLVSRGATVAVCSHLGRPKDGPEDRAKFSLHPCALRMGELLRREVKLAPDCVGAEVKALIGAAGEGDVLLLENTRFHGEEETQNEEAFAERLAAPFDLYVNDAFGTAHRAHASTEGVARLLRPAVSGLLLAKELEYLDGAIEGGERPMAAIVGGSKVSSKITVLEALLDKCDKVVIGGGMVFTFLKAQGLSVGTSLVEEDFVDTARAVLDKAEALGKTILLPSDIVVADAFAADASTQVVAADAIPDGWMGLDNGPQSTAEQKEFLADCKTVIMNGPLGVFEMEPFSKGTFGIIDILADLTQESGAITIIGGGDSVAATEQSGRAGDMSHISTGGGASLELLEGKQLPGVVALDDYEDDEAAGDGDNTAASAAASGGGTSMSLMKKTLADVDVKDKRVLMRVDFNVPFDKEGNITNNQRIEGAIPSIQKALDMGARAVVLMSHLGRPNGMPTKKFTLEPVAKRLGELMGKEVKFLHGCTGIIVEDACSNPPHGSIILLENVRFHAEEEGKGVRKDGTKFKPSEGEIATFRSSLYQLGDIYVCDAFGTAHRAHSSMVGMQGKMPCVAGLLVGKELTAFSQVIGESVERPLTAIVGGAKISDKVLVIENLIKQSDAIIICGGMAYTFLKECSGMSIGKSLYDKKGAELAPTLVEQAKAKGCKLVFPCDWLCGQDFCNDQETKLVTQEEGIPDGWEGMDCGPESMKLFREQVSDLYTLKIYSFNIWFPALRVSYPLITHPFVRSYFITYQYTKHPSASRYPKTGHGKQNGGVEWPGWSVRVRQLFKGYGISTRSSRRARPVWWKGHYRRRRQCNGCRQVGHGG